MDANESSQLVSVRDLKKHFPIQRGIIVQRTVGKVQAVDGITFEITRGETLGLVGESGCGKSTAGRTILGLYEATSGEVWIDSQNVHTASGQEAMAIRRKTQMIFQDL